MNYQIYSKNLHILSWLKFQAQTFSWINATAKPELLNTQTSAKNTTPSRASKNRKQEHHYIFSTADRNQPVANMAEARLFVRGSGLRALELELDLSRQTEANGKKLCGDGCKLRLVQPHSGWTTRGRRCNPTCANRRCCGSAACDSAAARLPAQRRGRLRLPSSHARAARSKP